MTDRAEQLSKSQIEKAMAWMFCCGVGAGFLVGWLIFGLGVLR